MIGRIALVSRSLISGDVERGVLTSEQAWQQDRLDLAKIMFAKLKSAEKIADSHLIEELSDLLFEVGKDLSRKSLWADATFWLEAAHDVIALESPDTLSSDAGELRVSIMHAMVKSLIHQGGGHNREKAWNIVRALSIDYGEKLVVLLLKLELIAVETMPSPEEYRHTVEKIMGIVHLTDSNIATILHHVHKLKQLHSGMAHAVLFKFLTDRLLGGEHQAWSEKILITVIWNLSTRADVPDAQDMMMEVFSHVEAHSGTILTPSATHAAQIMLWKRIEAAYGQEKYVLAEQWCNLSLHNIFNSSGGMNVGKLQRKLILCALGLNNTSKAWSVASKMSEINKADVSTQYLLYKCAIRCHDPEMASQCFNNICSRLSADGNKDASLIYACVLEAQRRGEQDQILVALQRVLEQYTYTAPSGVHLPALLRCTARLLMRSSEQLESDAIDSLCKIFEGAATQARRLREQVNDSVFTIAELDWFSRNCYNLSLKVCHIWPPQQTLRLMQAALKFIELYPADLDLAILSDLSLRRLFCDFVLCSLSIYLARNEDNIEHQLQQYLSSRRFVTDWRSHLPDQLSRLDGGARSDLITKHATLLSYDFEAAARLKSWVDFDTIITECQSCQDVKLYAILADIILASETPTEVLITSLQHIVNATWQLETKDVEKLSRWIRCIASQALNSDDKKVEALLEQVVNIVRAANETQQQGQIYPAEELEWLVTKTFNHAIDFYCSSQDTECRKWAEKALTLAALCSDGGTLHTLLQGKFQSLVWQD